PGEKLHEILLTEEEARHAREFETSYVVEPELSFYDGRTHQDGKPVETGFRYTSETNDWWLNEDELWRMIEGLGYEL
ncbi:MAG: UDP-N-acetylglucosamine 4,6-dehydratase (inverting), partial [Candidatus Thermoplasmatota archaeon]|nr:UDP-N-acetylglucosamine 4,6-dehydratase (inverting) [Candidatus Thermoplasmatota archaeon]